MNKSQGFLSWIFFKPLLCLKGIGFTDTRDQRWSLCLTNKHQFLRDITIPLVIPVIGAHLTPYTLISLIVHYGLLEKYHPPPWVPVDKGRKWDVQKTSWTSSERLMHVQFTSCVYGGPKILVFLMRSSDFAYGLITFFTIYELSFEAYLPIPVLISALNKMSQILNFTFYFRFRYLRKSPYSMRGVIISEAITTLGSRNSLVNSNWGALFH